MAQTALGNMFRLLSTAFQPPTERLAGLVASGTLARDIAATWGGLDLPDDDAAAFADALSQAYGNRDANTVLHELRRENTRLFLGDRPLVENELELAALLAESPTYLSEQGKDALGLLEEFITGHLKIWLPGFCADVIAQTKTPYYRVLCELTARLIDKL